MNVTSTSKSRRCSHARVDSVRAPTVAQSIFNGPSIRFRNSNSGNNSVGSVSSTGDEIECKENESSNLIFDHVNNNCINPQLLKQQEFIKSEMIAIKNNKNDSFASLANIQTFTHDVNGQLRQNGVLNPSNRQEDFCQIMELK